MGADLISDLLRVQDRDSTGIADNELVATGILLLNADRETTVNVIGNGLGALLAQLDQLAIVRASIGDQAQLAVAC
ncbi:MAG: hypothetical protein ABI206_05015 [Antricoccus sp.]